MSLIFVPHYFENSFSFFKNTKGYFMQFIISAARIFYICFLSFKEILQNYYDITANVLRNFQIKLRSFLVLVRQ